MKHAVGRGKVSKGPEQWIGQNAGKGTTGFLEMGSNGTA